jgi:hypothetical protein
MLWVMAAVLLLMVLALLMTAVMVLGRVWGVTLLLLLLLLGRFRLFCCSSWWADHGSCRVAAWWALLQQLNPGRSIVSLFSAPQACIM